MSELAIFSIGSVFFVMTTAATFAFGLTRFRELQVDDMQEGDRYPVPVTEGVTERHVSGEDLEKRAESEKPGD